MLLKQYGTDGLVFQILATGFKEAHLQDSLKFEVVEADKVGAKFRDAVKEAYNAKFLDDADMVIRFAVPKKEAPVEEPAGQSDDGENADPDKQPAENSDGDDVKEAEVSATGADLKKKIIDTVARCLYQTDKNKVELSDLDGFMDGYDVSFIKVSLKDGEGSVES